MSEQSKGIRLDRLCGQFRAKLKALVLQAGVGRVLIVAIALFAIFAFTDWAAHWRAPVRVLLLLLLLGSVGVVGWFTLVRPLGRRWSDRQVLAYMDQAVPDSGGMLLDLYELQTERQYIQEVESEQGRRLADQAVASIAPVAGQVKVAVAFQRQRAMTALTVAAALVALVAILCVPAGSRQYVVAGATRLFNPFSDHRWPHRTTITVQKPDTGWSVPQLESFTVNAEVTGVVPPKVTLVWRAGDAEPLHERVAIEQREIDDPAAPDGKRTVNWVQYTFPEVKDEVEFYLAGGDYETDWHTIQIVRRPFIEQITAYYDYPSYSGLPDRTVQNGQLSGLEGTKVTLEFKASMPLDKAVIVIADEKAFQDATRAAEAAGDAADGNEAGVPVAATDLLPPDATRVQLARVDDETFRHEMMLRQDGRYAVELYASNYREARPEVYEIRVTPDDPPEVELLSPGRDLVETNRARIRFHFVARDRLGLQQVQFLYRIDDGDPQVLTDHITGPIEQTGTRSSADFEWDFTRSRLPEEGTLEFWAYARDNNPTGRGAIPSRRGQVKLVRGSQFHLDAIEAAKLLEEEVRNAHTNQYHAWTTGQEFLAKGTGAEDDEIWLKLADNQLGYQPRAIRATEQIRYHLATLTEKYERNQMQRDFMSERLKVISQLLAALMEQQKPVADGIELARPKTASDAEPAALKGKRGSVVTGFTQNQKMAVLILERLLFKVYDWRDLQFSMVQTKLLYEQQEEVAETTRQMAPRWIGKEIVSLSDEDQMTLATLGKQQKAIADSEKGLEDQMQFILARAEQMKRESIRSPMQAAFGNLRNNRVQYHLKRAAQYIENNQSDQIIGNQEAAVQALKIVQAGLEMAGQKVDPDPPIDPKAMPMALGDVNPKPPEPKDDETETPDGPGGGDPPPPLPEIVIPPSGDPLSSNIRLAIEKQDNVQARTRYLAANSGPEEMPRFVKLKLLMLDERQTAAVQQIDVAADQAAKDLKDPEKANLKQMTQVAGGVIAYVREEFGQSHRLLKASQVLPTVQEIQDDSQETLKDLLQYIAMAQDAESAVRQNRENEGKDSFGRNFQLQNKNLELTLQMLAEVNQARQIQRDVIRKLERFQAAPPSGEMVVAIEKQNRQRAAGRQKQAAELLAQAAAKVEQVTADLMEEKAVSSPRDTVEATGVKSLAELALNQYVAQVASGDVDAKLCPLPPAKPEIKAFDAEAVKQKIIADLQGDRGPDAEVDMAKADELSEVAKEAHDADVKAKQEAYQKAYTAWEAARGPLREAEEAMTVAVKSLRSALEERVELKVEQAPADEAVANIEAYTDDKVIQEGLKNSDLPPELRDLMVRSLQRDMPPKYRDLLLRYYASFMTAGAQADGADQGNESNEGTSDDVE